MTSYKPVTPVPPAESAGFAPFTNSLVTRCFTRFLSAASELISAERDLSGYSGQDPAVDAWISDAEQAFSQTSAVLDELLSMPCAGAVETRLKRVGALFRFVMLSDNPKAVATVRQEAAAALSHYQNHARYGFGQRSSHMVLTGLQQLEAYLAVEDGLLPEDAVPGAVPMAVSAKDDAPVSAAA
jgi:hypothetical protein